MKDLSLYTICGEDMEIYAKKLPKEQIEIKVMNEDGDAAFHEVTHQAAWDSLVYFAKQVVSQDERINKIKGGLG